MEFDNIADKKDKYNRYLAWIWVDDELLQNLLVECGLAENYMLQNNYKYAGMLQESEEIAKSNHLGIWSDKASSIQDNESKNQIVEEDKANTEDNKLLYIMIGMIIILTVTIVSITYGRKKRQ